MYTREATFVHHRSRFCSKEILGKSGSQISGREERDTSEEQHTSVSKDFRVILFFLNIHVFPNHYFYISIQPALSLPHGVWECGFLDLHLTQNKHITPHGCNFETRKDTDGTSTGYIVCFCISVASKEPHCTGGRKPALTLSHRLLGFHFLDEVLAARGKTGTCRFGNMTSQKSST